MAQSGVYDSTVSDDVESLIEGELPKPSKSAKTAKPTRLVVEDDNSKQPSSAPSSPALGPKAKAKPKQDALTGEQISRGQAIAEISKVQRESAMKIVELVTETLNIDADQMVRVHLLERFDSEMERSKSLLLQHSKGLLGSDLAELRIQKSEKKVILDKVAIKNMTLTQEIAKLRQRLRNFPEDNDSYVDRILKSAAKSNSLQEFGRYSQACMLTILEQKLNSVFSLPLGEKKPELKAQKPQSRAENSFLKERVGRLEEQVRLLAEQIAAVQRQRAVLVATKEKLEADLEGMRTPSSSMSQCTNMSRSSLRRFAS